jgi:peroxiredoxin Q/BCP
MTGIRDFELPSTGGTPFRFSMARGRMLVLYFYPKDNTPGCTTEGRDFAALYPRFRKADCEIYGISRDSLKSHDNFRNKCGFPFELLSDAEEEACNILDVIRMKHLYGKQVRGVERSTFVFDRDGKLVREWRGVKVAGHAQEVLDFVETLE